MTLINYYSPELRLKSLDKLLDNLNADINNSGEKNNYTPETDIVETEKTFTINLSIPGVKKKDVKIELDKDKLLISGERKLDANVSGKFHKHQIAYGTFFQSFRLQENIDKDAINAKQEDGILSITLRKIEKKQLKSTIEVK